MKVDPRSILFLVGPTASGKTDVVAALSKYMDLEVISCDSMQVYRSMPILTQTPPLKVRRKVTHHLVDFLSARCEYNAAVFASLARQLIHKIRFRRRVPWIVGGTGLYVMALLDGLFAGPGRNKAVREKLTQEAMRRGTDFLYERLRSKDAKAALTIHPNDTRRIVRALEVIETSQRDFSEIKKKRQGLWKEEPCRIYGLRLDRRTLYDRINQRVDRMFRDGLVGEVHKIRRNKLSQTARMCLGIKEVGEHLDGRETLEGAREQLKQNTRRFAKRQIAWFKRDKRIRWISVGGGMTPAEVARSIMEDLWKKPCSSR